MRFAGASSGRQGSSTAITSDVMLWKPHETPAPAFALRDQQGYTVSLHGLRGKVIVMTFVSSTCTEECPLLSGMLAQVGRALGPSAPVALVAMSIAPTTGNPAGVPVDTPASVAAFITHAGLQDEAARGRFVYLMGSLNELSPVWKAYGVGVINPQPNSGADIMHTSLFYVIDQNGDERALYMAPFNAQDVITRVRALM